MAGSASGNCKDVSVRLQIFPHNIVKDKAIAPLKAFRLRLKHDSTFTDLAGIALARYAREDPGKGGEAAISTILDEKDCAVDMDDGIDIIKDGEVLKLVLVAAPGSAISRTPTNNTVTTVATNHLPGQTPAVKNIRPRTPAVLKYLVPGSNQTLQSSQRATSQTRTSQQLVKPSTKKSKLAVVKDIQAGGTGSKRDPYEVPSDTDNLMSCTTKPRLSYGQPPDLTSSAPVKTNTIPSDVKNILLDDSSSPSDNPSESRSSGDLISAAKSQEEATSIFKTSAHVGSAVCGKRSGLHTINSHLNIVEEKNKAHQTQTEDTTPAYVVKSSHGVRPIFLRKETPSCSTNTVMQAPVISASSAKSTKSSKSAGSLTLTPSRVAQALKSLGARFQRELQDRDAEKRRLAQEQAELEESRIKAKAKAKDNLPSAAIAHMKKITSTKLVRKESKNHIPNSFFMEPEYSDEDLGDIITGTQASSNGAVGLERSRAPERIAPQRSASTPKDVTPTTTFKPINSLRPLPKSVPVFQLPKKFGAGYSQQVRDAFSDSDTSDADSATTRQSTKENITEHQDVSTEDAFQLWSKDYDTKYIPHLGFCSVADGPFKGLIRGGPNHGKYLAGYEPPTKEKISKMEKMATRDVQVSDCDLSDYSKDSESDSEHLPTPNIQSTRTTSATDAETTSTCIMKQLSQEAPPSNQELGILMSSSPSRYTTGYTKTPPCRRSARLASNQIIEIPDSQTSESSPTLVVHESSRPPPVIDQTPKRNTKSHPHDTDLDITPNFERALSQVETPSTRSRSQQKSRSRNQKAAKEDLPPVGIGKIVVNIPEMSAEQQAKYKKVPDLSEQGLLVAPIRSFEDINRIHEDPNGDSQDSAAATIEQVLKASPSWLANVTEVETQPSSAPKKAPYVLRSQTGGSPPKPTSQFTRKRKVDEIKDLDSTYEPSEFDNGSDGSAHLKCRSSRNMARKHVNAAPRRAPQKEESTHAPLSASLKGAGISIPGRNSENLPRVPSLISYTPIPVPSIAGLLHKLQNEPNVQPSQAVAVSGEMASNTPRTANFHGDSEELVSESPPSTTISAATVPAAEIAEETGSQGNKRKHEHDYDTDINDITLQPRQKKQKERSRKAMKHKTKAGHGLGSHSLQDKERFHHEGGANIDDATSKNGLEEMSITRSLRAPVSLKLETYIKQEENSDRAFTAPYAATVSAHHVSAAIASDNSKARRKKQKKKNKRRQKRKIFRQAGTEAPKSAIPALYQHSSEHMTEKENGIFRHQTQDVKPSANGQSLTLPSLVAKPPTKQGFPASEIICQASASANKKKKHKKNHSKPVRKEFMSPPTTSRPSSAGSSI